VTRYFYSFSEPCGCAWEEGAWFSCAFHNERCYVCRTPIERSAQGLCMDCHDLKDREKPFALKVSPA
jgi:hypothetical protein